MAPPDVFSPKPTRDHQQDVAEEQALIINQVSERKRLLEIVVLTLKVSVENISIFTQSVFSLCAEKYAMHLIYVLAHRNRQAFMHNKKS